jgi:hypothetical protein
VWPPRAGPPVSAGAAGCDLRASARPDRE